VGNNPINRVDPDGQIAIVAAAAVAWAVVEVALSLSDAYDVVSTWADPEASLATKAGTTILAGAGLILPGGGYSKADDGIRAVANVVGEGTQAAAKKIDDVVSGGGDLFRVVDDVELSDIQSSGVFRTVPGQFEGKQFVDNLEDARKLQKKFSGFFGGNQTIVKGRAPQTVLDNASRTPFSDIPNGTAITVPKRALPAIKPELR
jgi:hypothetical protein